MKKLALILPLVVTPEVIAENNQLTFEGALGVLNGSSTEIVYESTGRKLSQLDWDINNVPIIKLGANWDLNEQWTFKGRFWSVVTNNGNAHMEDRDWLNSTQSTYTHISISPGTQLTQAYEIDLSATYWLINVSQYQLGVLGGYQYNTFKWDAIGGTYSYNNGADVGVFPNTVGIDYKQEFNALYLGLVGAYKFKQSEIGMHVKWSPWVNAKDKDNHYDRDLTFYEKSNESSDFLSVSVNYDYYYTQSVTLFAEYVYSQYSEAKADMTLIDNATGSTSYYSDGAGLDNQNSTITVGVKYRF